MRILVLWTQLSGYMRACLDRLGQTPGVELHVVSMPRDPNATFENHEVTPSAATCYWLTPTLDLPGLHDRLQPDVLVVCSSQGTPAPFASWRWTTSGTGHSSNELESP
jgi:hypothetical protein